MNKFDKREQLLLDTLKYKKKMELTEVIKLLNISESTARRLFIELEKKGNIIRTYGGIQLAGTNEFEYSYERLENESIAEKFSIGQHAAELIEDNDIVYFDAGTTVAQLCVAFSKLIETKNLSNIRVFTNSLVNLNILSDVCDVNLIGGEYRPNRKDFCGYITEKMIVNFRFTKCFLGADGVDTKAGYTTTDFATARINELVMAQSEEAYILADSSKIGKCSFVSYAKLPDAKMIITDRNIKEDYKKVLESSGIKISCI